MAKFTPNNEQPLSALEQKFKKAYAASIGEKHIQDILKMPTRRYGTIILPFTEQLPPEDQAYVKAMGNARRDTASKQEVGLQKGDRYLPIGLHSHTDGTVWVELMCVICGDVESYVGNTTGMLHAGDVLLVAPGTRHAFNPVGEDCLYYNVLLLLERFESAFQPILHSQNPLSKFLLKTLYANNRNSYMIFHTGDYFRCDNHLAEAVAYWDEHDEFYREYVNANTTMFLLDLIRYQAQPIEICMDTENDNRSQKMVDYVRNHIDTVTVHELMDVFSYSQRQMFRIFKQNTGMSCSDFIQHTREERFMALLMGSDISINNMLIYCGIRSASRFYSKFREKYGVSPIEYREKFSTVNQA